VTPLQDISKNPFPLQENGSLFVGFQAHIIDVVNKDIPIAVYNECAPKVVTLTKQRRIKKCRL